MTPSNAAQCAVFLSALLALVKPLGTYMAWVYEGEAPFLERVFGPIEKAFYRVCGVRWEEEMPWQTYASAMMLFNGVGLVVLYAIQRIQGHLPMNPDRLGAVSPDSAFNTAVSFVTNTDWQGYSGETTMSCLTQMAGLTVQNFISAATGMAVMVALTRGFVRKQAATIGNFWVDMTRGVLFVLLPLSTALALALVSQGVVQTFKPAPALLGKEVGALASAEAGAFVDRFLRESKDRYSPFMDALAAGAMDEAADNRREEGVALLAAFGKGYQNARKPGSVDGRTGAAARTRH
jgi:K+-transporting ATPase ATPase A chain